MKKMMKRVFGFGLSLALIASILPVGVLAADCAHSELEKGVCKGCNESYAAAVGDTLYKKLDDAIKAAKKAEDPAVTVLTDLNDCSLELENAYLAVEGQDLLTFENCSFQGEHENQVLLSHGNLILQNVTVENTKGKYALYGECTEGEDLKELAVLGGEYIGKEYGIGAKQLKLQLNSYAADETTIKLPSVSGETADFRLEDSVIEILCDLDSAAFEVETHSPGVFAFVSDYEEGAETKESWLKSTTAATEFDKEAKQWSVSDSISGAVTVGKTELVYNGSAQAPEITKVELYGKKLMADRDYTVSFTKDGGKVESAVNAGKYKMMVSGMGNYSGVYETEFEIVPAAPVVTWKAESAQAVYSGSAIVLTQQPSVTLLNDETFSGEVTYSHRAGNSGAFQSGLPVEVGTYQVKASVAAFGNYSGAETEALLTLTVDKKTDAKLSVEVISPEGGHVYTGNALTPEVTVKDGSTVVPADQYEVTYQNNTNVGTATVIVSAEEGGNYTFSELTASFEIKKAAAAELAISGQPETITYGDAAFQLGTSGGAGEGAVTWTVTDGSAVAAVDSEGKVTVLGVGKATVKAVKDGGENYSEQSTEWTFEVKPAVLTVSVVEAESKAYDGNKVVNIKKITLDGVIGNDDVSVSVSGVKGELEGGAVGTYKKITLPALTLTGAAAGNYTLTQPTAAVAVDVAVTKAEIGKALADIKTTVAVNTENLVVEHLGEGMPADAGTMIYTAKDQDTGDGAEVIVLDWGVDKDGKLTAKLVPGTAGDQVLFDVTISSDNYKDTVVRLVVTLGALTVEESKVEVELSEEEFTYNGKEQKPDVEVKYDGVTLTEGTDYELSYSKNCTKAGKKEVTVTFKGSYKGSATAKYTIDPAEVSVDSVQAKDKTYDGTTKATVTATLKGVVSGDDVKVTATGIFDSKNSGSNKTVEVTYKLSGDDAKNYELKSESGTTTAKITPVSATALSNQISGLSSDKATAINKSTLQSVVNQANSALEDTGISSGEKSALSNVKWNAEELIDCIESAAAALATDSIRKSEKITKETVTLNDHAVLTKAQSDLDNALTTYGGNYTTDEQTTIQKKKTRIAEALNVITRVQNAQNLIENLPDQVTEETAVDAALLSAVENAQAVYDGLNDYEKSLLNEDVQLKLTTIAQAMEGVQPDEKDEVMNQVSGAPEEGEGFKFPTWILVVAVIAAAACGGGLFLYKRKQEENEYNW